MSEILVFKHVPFEGPGTFRDELEKRGLKYRELDLYDEGAPKSLEGCGGLIIMGGPMNVYEEAEYPFLKEEDRLIKEALSMEIPIIGVCLGAQLIAKAAGAKVMKGTKKEIGWYPLHLTEEAALSPAFRMLPKEIEVFQWHGDTFELPTEAKRLASSKLYHNQAFMIGDNVYAFQFHIEVSEGIIREWVDMNKDELATVKDYIDPKNVLYESRMKAVELRRVADTVYKGLFEIFDDSL